MLFIMVLKYSTLQFFDFYRMTTSEHVDKMTFLKLASWRSMESDTCQLQGRSQGGGGQVAMLPPP